MGIPIFRSRVTYIFNSIFPLSTSTFIVASPRFLRRYFVFTVPHARVYDAMASFLDDILAPPAMVAIDICLQHDCIWVVDVVGNMARMGLEE